MSLLQKKVTKTTALFLTALPVMVTIVAWALIYPHLKAIAEDHSKEIVNYGPAAFIVALNRGRLRRMYLKTKMIVRRK